MMINRSRESTCVTIFWTFSVCFALYRFHEDTEKGKHLLDADDFRPGWFSSRPRDIADYEWGATMTFLKNYIGLFFGYICISQLIWRFLPELTLTVIIGYGSVAIGLVLNPVFVVIIWANIFIAFCLSKLGKPLVCHLFFLLLIIVHYQSYFRYYLKALLDFNDHKAFLFDILFGWLQTKCLSFSLDRIEISRRRESSYPDDNLTMIYAYSLYFPTLFFGPLHLYSDFLSNMFYRPQWRLHRLIKFMVDFTRLILIGILYEILTHYLYSSAAVYHVYRITRHFNAWSLCGFAYCVSIMFYVKYRVIYGIGHIMGNLDGVQIPPPPRCVSRIHLSSDLWRWFDRGLHLWLVKYYYKPIVALKDSILLKITASFICFCIVCIWHAMLDATIIWCSLNFIAVNGEMLGFYIRKNSFLAQIEARLSKRAVIRIKSALAAPFYLLFVISNTFFLANIDLGIICIKRVLISFPMPVIPALFIVYSACHVAIELKEN